ncbi:MAG: tyrosine-type recombinase/integrase [Phycisphaerales bacterium]|nr:tyrosine-type recombinase/integrase [Phycisphaerales bacterium]
MPQKRVLTKSSDGRWRKIIKGKAVYFGKVNPKGVNRSYKESEGRYFEYVAQAEVYQPIRVEISKLTIADFAEKFLQHEFNRYERKEICPSRFAKIKSTTIDFVEQSGHDIPLDSLNELMLSDYRDYTLSCPKSKCSKKKISIWTAKSRLDVIKYMIKWGYKHALIDQMPRNMDGYSRVQLPQPTIKRFSREEIYLLYDTANDRMKTFIVLALNCGFGQTDISNLRVGEIDLKEGRIIRKRSKTGVECQFALWPLTVKLLKEHGNMDGKPGDRVFVSRSGQRLVHEQYVDDVLKKTDCVRLAFMRLMKSLDIPQDRGFYALRKTAACEIERIDPMVTEMYLGHSERGLKRHYAERDWARLDEAIMELFPALLNIGITSCES